MATRSTPSSSRSGSAAKSQIVAALKDDHKKVKKAFRDFEKMDPEQDPESAQALVERTCAELEVHAELEEQLFYPAAREALKEEDLIDEAEVEHTIVKVLIEQLKGMNPGDPKYAATFKVLGEYINHHVKEEEGEIFPGLTRPGVSWEPILEQMTTRREELEEEKGLTELEDEEMMDQSDDASARSRRASRSGGRAAGESRPQASSSKSSKSRGES
ncbi:MAG TPA: hemerythrin domain-containing protein [Albitalea sp.]|nr:hemerythrin domain-containing protein [Albitalea sp.]